MKVKTEIRLSAEYQVSAIEMEIEVSVDSDLTETVQGMHNEIIPNAVSGLRKALGQLKAMKNVEENKVKLKQKKIIIEDD